MPTENKSWKRKTALFLLSQNISIFGSSVTGYAIIWYITLKTSSGVYMTMATLASMLPQMFVTLWGGVFADRHNRKWIIMLSDGFIALSTLALACAWMAGAQSISLLLLVSVIRSIGSGLQSPAVGALYPQIVPASGLARVNGINQTLSSILLLLSPAVGGAILGGFGMEWAFLLDVVTAALAIVVMACLKVEKVQRTEAPESALAELKIGLSFVARQRLLRSVMTGVGVCFFLMTPAACLTNILVARTYGTEVWRLTANELAWTLGNLGGGIYVAIHGDFKQKIKAASIGLAGFALCVALLSAAGSFWVYLGVMAVSGVFMPIISSSLTVLIQTHVAPEMMGRVFSILQIIMSGAMPAAMMVFGPLADIVSIELLLLVTGVLLAAYAAFFWRTTAEPPASTQAENK